MRDQIVVGVDAAGDSIVDLGRAQRHVVERAQRQQSGQVRLLVIAAPRCDRAVRERQADVGGVQVVLLLSVERLRKARWRAGVVALVAPVLVVVERGIDRMVPVPLLSEPASLPVS